MSLISSRVNDTQFITGVKVDSRKRKRGGVGIIRILRLLTVSMILLI